MEGSTFFSNVDFSNVDFSAMGQTGTDESCFNKPADNTAGFYFDEGIDTVGMSTAQPNHSFDSDLFAGLNSTMDNTIGNGSWSQLSPTTTLDNFATPHTPSFDSLFQPQYTNNNSKRPLQLDTQDFPQAKRHEGTDFAAFSPFVAPSVAPSLSATASSWGIDTQPTPSSETQILGLTDEAADVCAMWFSKYAILPGDRHIESLSQLTGEPAAAIRQWFGLMLKQGMAGHDSAYKSQTRLGQPEQQVTGNDFNTTTSQAAVPTQCSHDSTTTQVSTSQPALRGGKKGCTPTTRHELLCRDPNKIYQCTRKCGKRYGRKCDWKRNEEEGYPSKSWICSLCKNEGVEKVKPCFRKYHFSQHFRNIHPGVNSEDYEADSVVHTDTAFPRKCGFCTHRFSSRQDRIDHIAEHFKRGKCMLDWNDDEDESHDSDNMDDDDDDERPDSSGHDENSRPNSQQDKDTYGRPGPSQNGNSDGGSGSGGQQFQPSSFTQFGLTPSCRPCAAPPRDSCAQATFDRPPVEPQDDGAGSQYSQGNDGALQHIKPITIPIKRNTQTEGGNKDAVARDVVSGTLIAPINQGKEKLLEREPPSFDKQIEAIQHTALVDGTLITSERHSAPDRDILISAPEPPLPPPIQAKDVDLYGHAEKNQQLHIGATKASIGHDGTASDIGALVKVIMTLEKNAVPQGDSSSLSRNETEPQGPILSSHFGTDELKYKIQDSQMIMDKGELLEGCPANGQRSHYDYLDIGTSATTEPCLRTSSMLSNSYQRLNSGVHNHNEASKTTPTTVVGMSTCLTENNGVEEFCDPMLGSKNVRPETSRAEIGLSSLKESSDGYGLGPMNGGHTADFDASFFNVGSRNAVAGPEPKPSLTMEPFMDSVDDGGISLNLPPSKLAAFLSVKLLGTGGFGTVDEVVHRTTNLRVVRKTLKSRDHSAIQELKKEIGVLQKLRHPHIIRFLGAYSKGDKVSMLVSPVAEGTLAVWLDGLKLQKPDDLSAIIVKMYGCLASSVRYLHEQRPIIKHMDIKPQNILIVQGDQGHPHVILCDFGISSTDEPSETNSPSTALTRQYCAPEVPSGVSREQAADIWSLGCVFLEMAVAAFKDDNPLWHEFRQEFCGCNGKYYWQDVPRLQTWLSDFLLQATTFREATVLRTVKSMLHSEPSERPDAAQLTLVFTPGPCCLSWANENASFPGPAEEAQQVEMLFQKDGVDCLAAPQLSSDALRKQEHEHFARAKAWLQECSHVHKDCRRHTHDKNTLPTRLLEIQQRESKDPYVRVINSEDIPNGLDGVEYAVISHLWGRSDFILSTDLLRDDQGKLPREKLSQTVNDAIRAAERIGYHYVWLDSLCVLQDSEEDKLRECANMASVYRNAALTIVVDKASTSNVSDKEFTAAGENVTAAPFSSAATLSLFDYQSPGFGWDTRAWSLQERLLSHRILHLAGEQLYWECNALKASETFPHGLPSLVWEKVHTKPSATSSPRSTTPPILETKSNDAQFTIEQDGIRPFALKSDRAGMEEGESGAAIRGISHHMSPANTGRPLAYTAGIQSPFIFGSDSYCRFEFSHEHALSMFEEIKMENEKEKEQVRNEGIKAKNHDDGDVHMEVSEVTQVKDQPDAVSPLVMDLSMGGV